MDVSTFFFFFFKYLSYLENKNRYSHEEVWGFFLVELSLSCLPLKQQKKSSICSFENILCRSLHVPVVVLRSKWC